jgi:hypothetical protein
MSFRQVFISDEAMNELSLAIRDGDKNQIRSMFADGKKLAMLMQKSKAGITLPDQVDLLGILAKNSRHHYKIHPINIAFGMGNVDMCKFLLEYYENYGIQFSQNTNTGAAFALSQMRNEFPKGPGVDPIQDAQKVVQIESLEVAKQFEAIIAFRLALTRRLDAAAQPGYEKQFAEEKARLMTEKKPREKASVEKVEEKKEKVEIAEEVKLEKEEKIDEEANAKEEARKKEEAEATAAKAEIKREAQRRLEQETREREEEMFRRLKALEALNTEEQGALAAISAEASTALQAIITNEFGSTSQAITREIGKVRDRTLILQATRDAKINALTYLKSLLTPHFPLELKRFTQAMSSLQPTFVGSDQITYYPALAMSSKWNNESGTAKLVQDIASKIEAVEEMLQKSNAEYAGIAQQRVAEFARRRDETASASLRVLRQAAEKPPEQRLEELEELMSAAMEKPKSLPKAHLFSTTPTSHQVDSLPRSRNGMPGPSSGTQ